MSVYRYVVGLGIDAIQFKEFLKSVRLVDVLTGEILTKGESPVLIDYVYNTCLQYIISSIQGDKDQSLGFLMDIMPEFEVEISSMIVVDDDGSDFISNVMAFSDMLIDNVFKSVVMFEGGYLMLEAHSHDYIIISQILE